MTAHRTTPALPRAGDDLSEAELHDEPDRKLAAILAADVVGFSRMMGADEDGTLGRLRAARAAVIDPVLAGYRGRIFKVVGDGLLVEFPSVVLALRAAVLVQTRLRTHNAGGHPDHAILLRIGVHQGDVVVQGTDLLGDGVNIAARLEGLAAPGGICISARVREDSIGKLALPMQDGGERLLKNIARPIRVFHVLTTGTGATERVSRADGRTLELPPDASEPHAGGEEAHTEETTIIVPPVTLHSLVLTETASGGPARGSAILLADAGLTIGRQPPSDMVLPGGEVSRTHCRIEVDGHLATVVDLRSTNGTFVDGHRIEMPTRLHAGSLVRVGPYTLRYTTAAAPAYSPQDPDATAYVSPV